MGFQLCYDAHHASGFDSVLLGWWLDTEEDGEKIHGSRRCHVSENRHAWFVWMKRMNRVILESICSTHTGQIRWLGTIPTVIKYWISGLHNDQGVIVNNVLYVVHDQAVRRVKVPTSGVYCRPAPLVRESDLSVLQDSDIWLSYQRIQLFQYWNKPCSLSW